ncbi:hypothetical protein K1T71_001746 [Dendrolimus kikuchii]|uniref:Uncharacterized protein n=1 Tax=Dendrolimus kikuchii TaxID=765133 RepID=A0ACC1DG24_9NEOP|nr:hypothetical protein K1T71_001746 [Dendrolimus kikuchii]
MPQTNYDSENQQLCSQINAPYITSKDLSFTGCWLNTAVEKEILRGRELCEKKPRTYCKDRSYNVINMEAPKLGKSKIKHCGKIKQNKYNQTKTNPFSPRSRSPFLRSKSPSKTYNSSPRSRPKYSINYTRKCPLRIAELAVPTKRQCIDTWRNKNDILPGYMVERLRREVMNEKPIVKITDAIHYFNKRNPTVIKCNQKLNYDVFVKKQKKINPKRLQKELEHTEIKKLCAQFGHKIAQKLIKPLNIVLNRNLSKLSEVIAHDIFGMMENQKKISTNNRSYRMIQSEMASKVAIWIHSIMEDSLYKLMEEDLKDLEEEEGPVLDLLDELVENILNTFEPIPGVLHNILSAESIFTERSVNEEQQLEKSIVTQHSSDIINAYLSDHVACSINGSEEDAQINTSNLGESTIDKIISDKSLIIEHSIIETGNFEKSPSNENFPEKVAIKKSVSDEISYKESTSEVILEDLASINDIEREYKSGTDIKERISEIVETKNEEDNLSELITNELIHIILNIDKVIEGIPIETEKDFNLDNNDVINEDFMVESEHINLEVKSSKPSSGTLTKELKQTATYDVTDTEDSLVTIKHEDDFGDGDGEEIDILETTAKKREDHVSEVFTILTKESDDDRNKKVQFFETNMVMDENNQDSVSESSIKKIHDEITQHGRDNLIWKSSSEFIKPDIELQQPNQSLLSNADESWPKEIPSPVLKPSASVSKSITSLGRILESDETFQNSNKSESNIDIVNSIKNKPEIDNISYEEGNIKSKDKNDDFETDINLNPVDKVIECKTSISIKDSTENQNMKGKSSYELEFNIDEELRSLIQQFLHKDEKKGDIGTVSTKSQNLDETFVMETDLAGGEKLFETVAITNHKTEINSKTHTVKDEDKQKSKISEVILENVMLQNNSKEGSDEVTETIKYFCPSHKTKRDYRVNPLTAPSWVIQDCDDASKKCLALRSETEILKKFKESDIRKWNKNLNEAFANLRLWGDWIHNTCNIIIEMHERERVLKSKRSDVKNWIALKKNIDNDANLWTKFNQCTQRKYKRFHRTYKKHSKIIPTEYYLCVEKNRMSDSQPF